MVRDVVTVVQFVVKVSQLRFQKENQASLVADRNPSAQRSTTANCSFGQNVPSSQVEDLACVYQISREHKASPGPNTMSVQFLYA